MSKNEFIEVARVSEISDGKMKHVEVDGKEVLNDLSLFLFFTRIQ
jgi:hypothetical protein